MASKAAAHFLQFRIQYSSIAFLYYDYALTFPAEVKHMWKKKLRITTLLYICCRYALAANVLYALAQMGKLGSRCVDVPLLIIYDIRVLTEGWNSCDVWYKIIGVISVLGRAAVIVALTGRTYAVYSCNRIILALLTAVGITCIVLDFMHVPGLRCKGSSGSQTGLLSSVSYISSIFLTFVTTAATLLSILMVVFEFSAAILLTIRSVMEFRIGGKWRFDSESFFAVVFKQGIIYFSVVSIFTTAAVVLNFRAPAGSFFQRLPNAYTLPLSCTLIARFLLQLRRLQDKTSVVKGDEGQIISEHPQTLTEIRANTIIDSIILSDFGDGAPTGTGMSRTGGDWETESSQGTHGGNEKSRDEGKSDVIALDDIHVESSDHGSGKEAKPC